MTGFRASTLDTRAWSRGEARKMHVVVESGPATELVAAVVRPSRCGHSSTKSFPHPCGSAAAVLPCRALFPLSLSMRRIVGSSGAESSRKRQQRQELLMRETRRLGGRETVVHGKLTFFFFNIFLHLSVKNLTLSAGRVQNGQCGGRDIWRRGWESERMGEETLLVAWFLVCGGCRYQAKRGCNPAQGLWRESGRRATGEDPRIQNFRFWKS